MNNDAQKWFNAYQELDRRCQRLEAALERLEAIADVFAADQSGATDPRVGLVQPVSVADCEELNAAIRQAREAMKVGAYIQQTTTYET